MTRAPADVLAAFIFSVVRDGEAGNLEHPAGGFLALNSAARREKSGGGCWKSAHRTSLYGLCSVKAMLPRQNVAVLLRSCWRAHNQVTFTTIYSTITFLELGRATPGLFTSRHENVPRTNNEGSHTRLIRRQHFHRGRNETMNVIKSPVNKSAPVAAHEYVRV